MRILTLLFFLSACAMTLNVPSDFVYKEIETDSFRLASWQKITDKSQGYNIYIEGDGYAFNSRGKPTQDPTPHSHLVRNLAFADDSANVIYLARPCQYIKDNNCSQRHWTTARFAPEVINATHQAIYSIANDQPITLIGFSGGAQVAGLVAAAKTGLNIRKVISVAGNLDHLSWTNHHNLPPLNESMDLADYKENFIKIPQLHYVGAKDKVIPYHITQQFIQNDNIIVILPEASHNDGWSNLKF